MTICADLWPGAHFAIQLVTVAVLMACLPQCTHISCFNKKYIAIISKLDGWMDVLMGLAAGSVSAAAGSSIPMLCDQHLTPQLRGWVPFRVTALCMSAVVINGWMASHRPNCGQVGRTRDEDFELCEYVRDTSLRALQQSSSTGKMFPELNWTPCRPSPQLVRARMHARMHTCAHVHAHVRTRTWTTWSVSASV